MKEPPEIEHLIIAFVEGLAPPERKVIYKVTRKQSRKSARAKQQDVWNAARAALLQNLKDAIARGEVEKLINQIGK